MTNITRWDPFAELTSLQDRFNQLFNQPTTFRDLVPKLEQPLMTANFVPPVDVYEDEHFITLEAELPGITEKELEITLENNVLTFSGERRMEKEEKKENFHRVERNYGRFVRSFTLPNTVNPENIKAEFNNGILKIMLMKREEAKPKKITIGVEKTLAKGKAA
ncbi:MAG TPA: Hsp20/alpha crystallin family protein [Candidatus Angelobacter sp.]|jgi:HSP20 family protein|nr:Hsp20/alpha crystallin family protein [Candidatus Angelobacter sp.]